MLTWLPAAICVWLALDLVAMLILGVHAARQYDAK